jgi:hypothetical protein
MSSNSSRYPFTFRNGCHHGHGDALVAVHERVILRKALPKCGGPLNNVAVIATLRSRHSGFEGATIPDAE